MRFDSKLKNTVDDFEGTDVGSICSRRKLTNNSSVPNVPTVPSVPSG